MKLAILAVVLLGFLVPVATQATVYDLAADWSDSQNPFGPWALYKSSTQLFTINLPDWFNNGTNQHAWADQPYAQLAHVPVWAKSNAGGVTWMHGAELDRTGSKVTSLEWTSPENATAIITGTLWMPSLSNNRIMAWELRKNGLALTGGQMTSNGTYTQTSPLNMANGWGGAGVLTQQVTVGDKIQLVFTSISQSGNLGDTVHYTYAITTSQLVSSPPGWLNAGWNYFSIPNHPDYPGVSAVFGGQDVANRLYEWDDVNKTMLLYPGDILNLAVGQGYLLLLDADMTLTYRGMPNTNAFEIPIPEAGWTWIGQPFTHDTPVAACSVRNNTAGVTRTATEDSLATDPWLNWNTVWWDSAIDSWKLSGLSSCDDYYFRTWRGYLVWANTRDLALTVPAQ